MDWGDCQNHKLQGYSLTHKAADPVPRFSSCFQFTLWPWLSQSLKKYLLDSQRCCSLRSLIFINSSGALDQNVAYLTEGCNSCLLVFGYLLVVCLFFGLFVFPEAGFLYVAPLPLSIIIFSLDGGLLFEPNWSHIHRHPLALPGELDKSVQQALHPAGVFFFNLYTMLSWLYIMLH